MGKKEEKKSNGKPNTPSGFRNYQAQGWWHLQIKNNFREAALRGYMHGELLLDQAGLFPNAVFIYTSVQRMRKFTQDPQPQRRATSSGSHGSYHCSTGCTQCTPSLIRGNSVLQ